jgi:HAE1 family hydrophobic/amphiphilic exporter-1
VLAYWFLRAPKVHKHAGGGAGAGAGAGTGGAGAGADGVDPSSETASAEPLTTAASDPNDPVKLDRLRRVYVPVLRGTLRRPVVTIVVALLILGGTGAVIPLMKTNFLGSSGQNTFTVTQTLAPASSLDTLSTAATKVEDVIEGIDGIDTVQLTIGSSGTSISSFFGGTGDSTVTYSITTDEDADQEALQADVRSRLADVQDAGTIELAASSGFGTNNDITVDVSAPDPDTLATATQAVLDQVSSLPGTAESSSNLQSAQPIIGVTVDRDAAAALGYSEVAVGGIVSQAVQPFRVGSLEIDDNAVDVYTIDATPPSTLDDLRALELPSPTGPVRLDSIATVEQSTGPTSVTTKDAVRTATVTVTPSSDDLSSAGTEVNEALAEVDLPAGADAVVGGATADQANAFSQLGLAVLIAILIVYIVMVATFRSLAQPLLLLVSIPFAATGAILLQLASGIPLGVASLIGVLMLVGIVVTNAIVLIDLVNQYRSKGLRVREALLEGASRRLRPILMTATATIFALTPMALGITGHGGFISQPLAIVVIGGLVSSTLLTLVVLPVLYYLYERIFERRADRRAEGEAGAA